MGQIMWYTMKVGPEVVNAARYLVVHMNHPGTEHWKSLGLFIGYLKGIEKKGITDRKPKVIKTVIYIFSKNLPLKNKP